MATLATSVILSRPTAAAFPGALPLCDQGLEFGQDLPADCVVDAGRSVGDDAVHGIDMSRHDIEFRGVRTAGTIDVAAQQGADRGYQRKTEAAAFAAQFVVLS